MSCKSPLKKICIDVIQLIGLKTESTQDYLNLALCCKRYLKILKDYDSNGNYTGRKKKMILYFTKYHKNSNGDKIWTVNGKFHKFDGPARECRNGFTEWYILGKLHREDGPAIVDKTTGAKWWYFNGLRHRPDGPAVVGRREISWWFHGKRHRTDGPANEGNGLWYINGKRLN